jgi:hypothetical protein
MRQAVRRLGGWVIRCASFAVLLTAYPANRLTAQLGHDPAQSPYRDIARGTGFIFFAGHLSGGRGKAGVGPSNALSAGLRYEMPLGRAIVSQFTAAYLKGDRFIVNPAVDSTSPDRRTGPADAGLLFTEMALQLRLTGGKTWHGVSPYLGSGLGLAFDLHSPGDTTKSEYRFGTKVTFTASAGLRWYPARKMVVQLDGRVAWWRLKYPSSFKSPAPDSSRVIPLTQPLTDWTRHPWVSLGIGWIF